MSFSVALCVVLLLALVGCTDDTNDDAGQRVHELRLSLGSPAFVNSDAATRGSGDLPSNFVAYYHGGRTISQIQCYMTYDQDQEGSKKIPCVFSHEEDATAQLGHVWKTKVPLYTLTEGNKYYLYGFMPKESVGSGATIEPYDDNTSDATAAVFSKGAVMTLTGLNAVTPDDICVIVGAKGYGKEGNTNVPDMSLRLGRFDYYPETDGDNLYLLVDHIYAQLKFNMKLDEEYAKLRGIKVTKMTLTLIPENGEDEVVETVNATVTVVANTDNYNPITPRNSGAGDNISGSVKFTNQKTGKNPTPAELYKGEGKLLSTTSQEFLACLCPSVKKKFSLETTFNVYDRKGNPIREGETARNTITIDYDLKAGQIHNVDITVQPTFLYMLSEPDLDNPTVRIEN